MSCRARPVYRWWMIAAIESFAALIAVPHVAHAQNASLDDLQARVERLERENQQLKAQLAPAGGNASAEQRPDEKAIEAVVDQRISELEAQKKEQEEQKKQEAAEQGYVIGSDLSAKASFKGGLFPWIETPNKDFSLHIGCWVQWDNVWWYQTPGLLDPKGSFKGPGASGVPGGGIGNLEDGVFFRRIRPNFEGTFWENGEYRIIPAFENNQFNTVGIDEMWVGAKNLPVVGTVRAGHIKNPLGLEGDMNSSSRCMTFMERSSYSEAIELNQNFATGIWFGNALLDERMTWSCMWFRGDVKSSTDAFFGDGQGGVQARLTGLPMFEDEGRHLLHVGLSGGWRNGTVADITKLDVHTIQLSARPELRDDVPGGSGTSGVPNANNSRMVDTGAIATNRDWLAGLELLYIRGPLSLQAEYGWNWVDNATGIVSGGKLIPLTAPTNYMFNGGYAQLAYTLTGENRGYDKRFGSLSRAYFGSQGPYNSAWVVRDENGNWSCNTGAWEVAARYSYVNLNSGFGTDAIQGGIMGGVSLGLNWYLNPNMTVNFEWVYDNRYDLPGTPTSTNPGYTSGFGTRAQFQF